MTMKMSYIRPTLWAAIEELTSPESFHLRVKQARMQISTIKPELFDDDGIRTDFEWIMSQSNAISSDGTDVKICDDIRQRILGIYSRLKD